jgi:alkanesulfonate monooxygenase SsuD/methylene tetrahydromethanopterin reductase-like flavin-dependent oxidoreductase (luciferase family)
MQFGVTDHIDTSGLAPGEHYEQRLRLVELYDRLGFARYMLTEHHGTPLSLAPSPHLFLAAASQRTSRIRLGTLVTLLPLYNPLRVIEEVGMLDHLTGGRLEVGLGRGVAPPELLTYGVDPEDTQEMFDEEYDILTQGLTSDAVSYNGRFYSLEDVMMVLRPVQQPRPPFWYGVGSVQRAQWAAVEGINIMALRPAQVVRPFTDAFLEAWEKTGRPVSERPLRGVDRPLVIAEDGDEARRVASEAHVSFHKSLMMLWDRNGITPPSHFPPTFELWQEYGGAFAGTPEEAREFVADEIEVAGIDTMNLHLAFGNLSYDDACRTAELFATAVAPAFAQVGART